MAAMASVDVVIPCYNYGRFLAESVGSVLSQPGIDLRVLIIDNASEDDSAAVARALARADKRVQVIAHAVNKGATKSYNDGVDWARGDYFLILDADDMLAPGALARATAALDRHPECSFAHGIEARLEANGTLRSFRSPSGAEPAICTGMDLIERLCRTPVNIVGANTVVRRTSAQKRAGHYRPSLPYTDDLEMWLRLAAAGKVAEIPSVQAIRRFHTGRGSTHYESVPVRDFIEREAAFESFFAHEGSSLPRAAELLALARKGLGEHAYWSAISHLLRGHGRAGVALMRLSHHWRPRAALVPPLKWLLRMDRPLQRAGEIVREALSMRRQARRGLTASPD
jgi:glycosyltransferase involved in cell wall biosynthesis